MKGILVDSHKADLAALLLPPANLQALKVNLVSFLHTTKGNILVAAVFVAKVLP